MNYKPNVSLTLDDAVAEVLGHLTGLDLTYQPEMDRYYAITRHINRALRLNAQEVEWSCYSSMETVGTTRPGVREYDIRSSIRPRVMNDDAIQLVDGKGVTRLWAYVLPRESIHKYANRQGLWVAVTGKVVTFSRPFTRFESGLKIVMPAMREPVMFELPKRPLDPNEPVPTVPDEVRDQLVDFDYPDVIILRAAAMDAASNPVLQPRVQTLEGQWTDMMYNLKERDERFSDSPYMNEFRVPVENGIYDSAPSWTHGHPHSDERH